MKNYLFLLVIPLFLVSCSYKEPKATFELVNNSNGINKNPENLLGKYKGVVKENESDSIIYSFDFYNDHTYIVKIDKAEKDSTKIHQGTWVSNGNYFVIYGEDATAYRFLKDNNHQLSLLNDDGRLYPSTESNQEFVLNKQ